MKCLILKEPTWIGAILDEGFIQPGCKGHDYGMHSRLKLI